MPALSVTVNGRSVESDSEPRQHLADFLREDLRLTGTHLGCEHGVCGACTVLLDGEPARSCIAYAVACDGMDVRTIEGFADDALMQALRDAFARHHALQCGYCTPGMLITAHDIIRRLPDADRPRIREELAGNLCRCTGYVGIVDAIAEVLAAPPRAALEARPEASPPLVPPRDVSDLPRADASRSVSERGPASAPSKPAAASPGNRIARSVQLAAPADRLWRSLRDPRVLVRCLPGAELLAEPDGDRLVLRMNIAIGPMRACFDGDATIHYDDARRHGHIQGAGIDSASRTQADGTVAFEVAPGSAENAEFKVTMEYRLSGPLAQFSRGAVVDAVVDQVLAQFTANLADAASGECVSDQRRVGGFRLALAALWRRIHRRSDS